MMCFIGIYLEHRGNCYPNGSYFWDNRIKPDALHCAYSGILSGGEWIGPAGKVPCTGYRAYLFCYSKSDGVQVRLSLFIYSVPHHFLDESADGWYKCCLPTNCSDPSTNIIFANIFSKRKLSLILM